jgi:hypothetical protein
MLTLQVHQQIAADRRHHRITQAVRSRFDRHRRAAAAPDLTRTADAGSSVLPVRSTPPAVRVGHNDREPMAA